MLQGDTVRWVWLAGMWVTACNPTSNVCNQTTQPIPGIDGGASRCVQALDCPRQAEQYVCTSDGIPTVACVSCDALQCTLHVPVPCQ
jgi:hypothetical protein